MQVLIIAVADFPEGFATAERIKLLGKAMMSGGCSVHVGLIHATRNIISDNYVQKSGEHQKIQFEFLNGNPRRPDGFVATCIDTVKGIVGSCKKLIKLKATDPDTVLLLYTPNLIKCLPVILTAKILSIKIIFEFCEVRSAFGSQNKATFKRKFSSLGDTMAESFAPSLADGIIAISSPIIRFYEKKGMHSTKLIMVPALIDVKSMDGKNSVVDALKDKPFFLSSGSYGPKEGIDTIIKAFSIAAKSNSLIQLAFTGVPPESIKNRLEIIASENGFRERLHFLGYLSRQELYWSYKNATALLACRSYSPFAEYGFPTKFVEYMASGSPVIVTNVGDPHKYIEDGISGFVAKADDPESISLKMLASASMKDSGKTMGKKGLEIAKSQFDYRQYSKDIIKLFGVSK